LNTPTYDQVSAYLEKIIMDYTISRAKLLKENSWQENDARIVIFTKGIRVMNGIQIGFSHLSRDLRKDDWWKTRYPKHTITSENKQLLMEDFDNLLRSALIVETYGIFESTVRIIANSYSSKIFPDVTINFSQIYPKFLNELQLQKFVPLVKIWSNIRNSIHNDSHFIPTKKQEQNPNIDYDGHAYKFRAEKPIIYAGWKDLCELSYELGKATHQIITSEKISSIQSIEEPGSKYWHLKKKTRSELENLFDENS